MYLFNICTVGGDGGGPYSHAESLEAAGNCLGAGAQCMRLSKLHVEQWQVLSHHQATYTSVKNPSKTFTPTGQGNITNGRSGVEFDIPPDNRVVRICASFGDKDWMAGGRCLNFLEIETAPVVQDEPHVCTSIGTCFRGPQHRQQPGTHKARNVIHGEMCCTTVCIPDGMTLAGIAGKAGDSWDQVTFLVCPWLPTGGEWDCSIHKHLVTPFRQQVHTLLLCLQQLQTSEAIPPLPKQISERLAAALFDVTFFGQQLTNSQASTQVETLDGGAEQQARIRASAEVGPATEAQDVASKPRKGWKVRRGWKLIRKRAGRGGRGAGTAAAGAGEGVNGEAAVAGLDFIGQWIQQQVQQARQASEVVLSNSHR